MSYLVRAGVDTSMIHPELHQALVEADEACFAATGHHLEVESGGRTKAKQTVLYRAWRAWLNMGKPPPPVAKAADPDRGIGTVTIDGVTFRAVGSWHMIQGDGYHHAVDIAYRDADPLVQRWVDANLPWAAANTVTPFGLHRTVAGEPWHVQRDYLEPLDFPEDDMTDEQAQQLAEVHALLLDTGNIGRRTKETTEIARLVRKYVRAFAGKLGVEVEG
jgi:hypothetical protein